MSSSQKQKQKAEDLQVPAASPDHEEEHSSGSGSEIDAADNASPSTSTPKTKKKNRSKISKALGALRGNSQIPQELVNHVLDKVKEEGGEGSAEANQYNVREALEQLKIMDVVKGKAGPGGVNKKDMGTHKFWGTQPVPQPGEGPPLVDGYIEPPKPREEVRQEPYPLPKDFEWSVLDIDDPKQNKEVYDLLSLNYVEDDEASFRFQYSAEFLQWALKPPGYHKEWHVGVRVSSNKKLVAFISGVPMNLRVREHLIPVAEINYLCVHKKLRSKRLAPVLIKEVTRQVNLKGTFQAIYTAGLVVPTPVSVCRYYHRLLNVPKLVDIRFCYVPRNMTLARMIRVNKVPSATATRGLREMEEKDVPQVADLFTRYMKRFDMFPIFDLAEVRHQFLSGRGTGAVGDGGPGRRVGQVTWTHVVEDPETHKITDFFSFYSLPSTVIHNTKFPVLEAAYLFYYASETAFISDAEESGQLKKRLESVIGDALVVANEAKFDVFNALTLMDNVPILQDLKFGIGDGILNFYLYNWRTAPLAGMKSEGGVAPGRGIGVVML
ncbi:putative adds a myristoyl group to the N-terminal glycine residue of certain cellular proteins [Lyophyllum shimeji]|uniref:Glycylpeptide N-tetradecanoyltransferase n=1 Tax=Lyophyllum shimeji TaxID=47721 RepID=A0A9P3PG83_LYOSH|nr:putative adds a myristoyl group to the N-terminal glycine residue of certain cellular proteins [Lyophyllum shimeji]